MSTSSGRVAVFTVLGVLLAVLVGFAVWAGSGPSHSNRAGFTADAVDESTQSEATSTASSSTTSTSAQPPTTSATATGRTSSISSQRASNPSQPIQGDNPEAIGAAISGAARASAPQGYVAESDPFMPPHAVVNSGAGDAAPSRVYRPTNISPTATTPAPPASPAPETTATATTSATASTEDEPATSSTPTDVAPVETSQPTAPAAPRTEETSDPATPVSEAREATPTPSEEERLPVEDGADAPTG